MSQIRRQKELLAKDPKVQLVVFPMLDKKIGTSEALAFNIIESLKVYIDGPVTFVTFKAEDKTYTGWSKFNANDDNYSELGGIARAFKRALEKVL